LDRSRIPNGTDLLVVRTTYPLSELDPGGDLTADSQYLPAILQHTDINHDGQLWVDANGDGVVQHADQPGASTGVEDDPAVDWGRTEIQRWEYERFDQGDAEGNTAAISVHHPLERWKDGLYLALWHPRAPKTGQRVPVTHVHYRV